MYTDINGDAPIKVADLDNDGVDDYYLYTYTYTTGFWFWKKEHTGNVHIYTALVYGDADDYFADSTNIPEGFNSQSDVMVGYFENRNEEDVSKSNSNMYVYRADRLNSKYRTSVITCMLQFDNDYDTLWDRSEASLLTEWKEHHRYALFSTSAKNVDFDNNEEGKGFWYFLGKAWNRFWG